MKKHLLFTLLLPGLAFPALAASVFTTRLEDPRAVYLTAQEFGAHGDGTADDSAALQAAVDKAGGKVREGIVFVPSGRYRLTRTLYVWPGVRVIGFGVTRPVFVLATSTPGFQKGVGDMVIFTGVESEEELKHKRPDEYARLVRNGKLESRIGPEPATWLLNFTRVVGTIAILIGLTLLVLTLTA